MVPGMRLEYEAGTVLVTLSFCPMGGNGSGCWERDDVV